MFEKIAEVLFIVGMVALGIFRFTPIWPAWDLTIGVGLMAVGVVFFLLAKGMEKREARDEAQGKTAV